jgi:quercetin dioxygenase-like cupin family protein
LILALFEEPAGTPALPGNRVVYDLERGEAHFGEAAVDGAALVWELGEHAADGAALAARVDLDPSVGWLMRCDRIDFPPGGVAYRHTHPGPGIRRLLFGSLRVETAGGSHTYGPGGAWFESGPDPVYAAASDSEPSAFVRVMLVPREWEGKRTIRYVDPADEEKPKLQRATIFFDRAIEL